MNGGGRRERAWTATESTAANGGVNGGGRRERTREREKGFVRGFREREKGFVRGKNAFLKNKND